MEKGKISAFQMGLMMYPAILATALLIVPGITGKYAKNDLWLSPIWGSLVGYLTFFTAYQLHKLYPEDTMIQYSRKILGSIPGAVSGLIFLIFYLHIIGLMLREYSEFIVGTILSFTPISVVSLLMMVACAYAVTGGVEVLARIAQFFIPFVVVSLLIMFLLLIPDMHPKHLFPVLEHGIMPSIRGAATPQAWFSEFFLISFLLPVLRDRENGKKSGLLTILAVTITLAITNLVVLLVSGRDVVTVVYPLMDAAMYISFADFFENLDAVVMAIWVIGAFIKISAFFYAATLGTAQWLRLTDYRPLVLPMAFLIFLFSFWGMPTFQYLFDFIDHTGPFYLTLLQTVFPFFLLLIAWIRNRKGKKGGRLTR